MKHYGKTVLRMGLCLFLCAFMLMGCKEQETVYVPVTSNTVEAAKDGRLIAYIVEDFDKDYYDINELAEMVAAEADAYNRNNASPFAEAGQSPVQVEKVMMAEDGSAKAVVALSFRDAAVYRDYMGTELFYGTVSQAMQAGYDLEGRLFDVKKGTELAKDKLEKNADRMVLIIREQVMIRTEGKVLSLSSNAVLTEQGYVDATADEGTKYIIIK